MRAPQSTSTITKMSENCWGPLVDNADEEATKAKLKELDQLAEFGVYETVDMHVALGKKLAHRKDGIRARFLAREFKGEETMYDVFAPSSTPSTGRVIDYFKSQEVISTHSNAYFHMDDEACYVDPPNA